MKAMKNKKNKKNKSQKAQQSFTERIAKAEALKAAIDGKSVTVDAKIGEEGQLFGSVTVAQIADAIKAQLGTEVDRKRVGRGNAIKTVGAHSVEVNFYRDITAVVTVLVGVTEAEAAAEAAEEEAEVEETEAAAEETTEDAE